MQPAYIKIIIKNLSSAVSFFGLRTVIEWLKRITFHCLQRQFAWFLYSTSSRYWSQSTYSFTLGLPCLDLHSCISLLQNQYHWGEKRVCECSYWSCINLLRHGLRRDTHKALWFGTNRVKRDGFLFKWTSSRQLLSRKVYVKHHVLYSFHQCKIY